MPFCGLNRLQYGNSLAWFRVLKKFIIILTCSLLDFKEIIWKKILKIFIDSYILAFVILHFFLVIFQCKIELWGILPIDNLHILYIFFLWPGYFDQFRRIQYLVDISILWFSPASGRTELFFTRFAWIYKVGKMQHKGSVFVIHNINCFSDLSLKYLCCKCHSNII